MNRPGSANWILVFLLGIIIGALLFYFIFLPQRVGAQEATAEPPIVVTPPFTIPDDPTEDTPIIIAPVPNPASGIAAIAILSSTAYMLYAVFKQSVLVGTLRLDKAVGEDAWRVINLIGVILVTAVIYYASPDRPNLFQITNFYSSAPPLYGELVTIVAAAGGETALWAFVRGMTRQPVSVVQPASVSRVDAPPPR
jgi:hypothetical protein